MTPRDHTEDLVEVATFPDRVAAELAHGALTADGIDSVLVADDVGGQYAGVWPRAIRLLVRPADAAQARLALTRSAAG